MSDWCTNQSWRNLSPMRQVESSAYNAHGRLPNGNWLELTGRGALTVQVLSKTNFFAFRINLDGNFSFSNQNQLPKASIRHRNWFLRAVTAVFNSVFQLFRVFFQKTSDFEILRNSISQFNSRVRAQWTQNARFGTKNLRVMTFARSITSFSRSYLWKRGIFEIPTFL